MKGIGKAILDMELGMRDMRLEIGIEGLLSVGRHMESVFINGSLESCMMEIGGLE